MFLDRYYGTVATLFNDKINRVALFNLNIFSNGPFIALNIYEYSRFYINQTRSPPTSNALNQTNYYLNND